jgi:hypothetical protein
LPFDRLVEEDTTNRQEVARLVTRATEHGIFGVRDARRQSRRFRAGNDRPALTPAIVDARAAAN